MKISVIVPVYNVELYIEKCLNSLIQLDERVVEIICVNDGTPDNSVALIKNYMKKDSRVRLIEKENGGLSSARNLGVKNSCGEYLLFVDSDDYIFPDKFNDLLDEVEKILNLDLVWTGYYRDDWNGLHEIQSRITTGLIEEKVIKKELLPSVLGISYEKLYSWFRGEKRLNQDNEFPSVWRALYSKEIIDRHKISFNENVKTGEDLLFNWEYLVHVKKAYISSNDFYVYLWREGSLTNNSNLFFFEAKKILVKERTILNERIIQQTKQDFSNEYQGSLVLSKLQMALALSKGKVQVLLDNMKKFEEYSNSDEMRTAYAGLDINQAPAKYKFVFKIAKNNWNKWLFLGCFILNKLKVHIYPDE